MILKLVQGSQCAQFIFQLFKLYKLHFVHSYAHEIAHNRDGEFSTVNLLT